MPRARNAIRSIAELEAALLGGNASGAAVSLTRAAREGLRLGWQGQREHQIHARDTAILERLHAGHATRQELLDVMPFEMGQTAFRRADALSNAITRLKAMGKIRSVGSGKWGLP